MASNHTPNFNLSQWEKTDKVQMEDFNADNAKIDAALACHPSGELIASVTVEEELARLELDLTQVDWSRYLMLMLSMESPALDGFEISMCCSDERCTHIHHRNSAVVSDYFSAITHYSSRMTMLMPVLYDGNHAPLVFAAGHGIYLNAPVSEFSSGGGSTPLNQCRAVRLSRNKGKFLPGDKVILWGVK